MTRTVTRLFVLIASRPGTHHACVDDIHVAAGGRRFTHRPPAQFPCLIFIETSFKLPKW